MKLKCRSCGCEEFETRKAKNISGTIFPYDENENDDKDIYNFKKGRFDIGKKICVADICNNCQNGLRYDKYKLKKNDQCNNCNCYKGYIENVKVNTDDNKIVVSGSCTNCGSDLSTSLIKKEGFITSVAKRLGL